MRHFKHLTFTQRLQLEAYLKADLSTSKIAELLGVHKSTVYREINRGQYEHLNSDYTTEFRYSPDIAEQKYRDNLSCKGPDLKISNDREFADYIEDKIINDKYSPAAVLGEVKSKGLKFNTVISESTIYSYIEKGVFLNLTNKNLPVKRNRSNSVYNHVKVSRPPKGTSIEKRPEEVSERNAFGHWEMDCVVGKKEKGKVLLVFTERKSRNELIRIMKDKTSHSVVKAIDRIERQIGSNNFKTIFKSITVDNGCEFQDFNVLERSVFTKSKRTRVYYCHPYSSYERGSNENQNKLIRRHYPKGTSFDSLKQSDVDKLQDWINNYPREIFGWNTSNDVFEACLNSI